MSIVYDLKLFKEEVNNLITVKISIFMKESGIWHEEFIQGILKSVNIEKKTITIEQHFPYYYLLIGKRTQTKLRICENGKFFMLSCGKLKAKE